jgi:flagellar biosynthesis component FlhA
MLERCSCLVERLFLAPALARVAINIALTRFAFRIGHEAA